MPRNGGGVFSLVTGYDAEPNEVIQSAVWNSVLEDLEQDANTPRPASSGGTGLTSLQALLDALALLDLEDFAAALATEFGAALVTISGAQTLTNKRITKRVVSTTSTSTLTIDSDAYDGAVLTAQAASLTIAAPTGTPTDMQTLVIRIKDNSTPRSFTWNGAFEPVGELELPTGTEAGEWVAVLAMWSAAASKWQVLAVNGGTVA